MIRLWEDGMVVTPPLGEPGARVPVEDVPARRPILGPQGPLTASAAADDPAALGEIARALGTLPFATVMLFAAPGAPFERLATTRLFPGARVIGCSTAGEITAQAGYDQGRINAVALPASLFATEEIVISPLTGAASYDPREVVGQILRARQRLARARPEWLHEFAFLIVDGLSGVEDALAAAVGGGLGPVPLLGGSAGDGTRFGATRVIARGEVLENAAVLTLVRTACPVQVFSLDHLEATPARMIVTEADPERRAVVRINDEPAAAEYARLLGLSPADLSPFTFAANPVLVRAGGRHHVRAIKGTLPTGEMIFFSAIDEGLVLTLARPLDIAEHLEEELASLARGHRPSAILACDCIFRRMEAQERQATKALSDILVRHRVTGFSTYGEQIGAMHVNQTMTGIAFYPPRVRR